MEGNTKRDKSDDASVQQRTRLFHQYIEPHLNLIYSLSIRYTRNPLDVEDNYSESLANLFRYVDTYDPARNVKTWIWIVTKRLIHDLNNKVRNNLRTTDDVDVEDVAEYLPDTGCVGGNSMGRHNYRELYNDDILRALDLLKPIYREALLLQQAGYKLEEIMEISFQAGNLRTRNIETVKSRLFLAKQQMRRYINRDGDCADE